MTKCVVVGINDLENQKYHKNHLGCCTKILFKIKTTQLFCVLAGDSLNYYNGQAFSTKDRDNDLWSGNCAIQLHGAWWFKYCPDSDLNGRYFNESDRFNTRGINWVTWKIYWYSLKGASMKIRPNN